MRWSRCQPGQEPCVALLSQRQESCATGGSNIWSGSVCQGEGAICQAKQDFAVYEKGKGISKRGEKPVLLEMLLAGTGQALAKRAPG